MKLSTFALTLIFSLAFVFSDSSHAQKHTQPTDSVIIQVVHLDHADAEHLASVLAPLLSPEGRIVAYGRTNSLIIKDRASIVKALVEIIKGPVDQQP